MRIQQSACFLLTKHELQILHWKTVCSYQRASKWFVYSSKFLVSRGQTQTPQGFIVDLLGALTDAVNWKESLLSQLTFVLRYWRLQVSFLQLLQIVIHSVHLIGSRRKRSRYSVEWKPCRKEQLKQLCVSVEDSVVGVAYCPAVLKCLRDKVFENAS